MKEGHTPTTKRFDTTKMQVFWGGYESSIKFHFYFRHLSDTKVVHKNSSHSLWSKVSPCQVLSWSFIFWASNLLKFVWNSNVVSKLLASSVFVAHHVPRDFIHYVKYNIVSFSTDIIKIQNLSPKNLLVFSYR